MRRLWCITAAAPALALVLALVQSCTTQPTMPSAPPAAHQSGGYSAEITKIDIAEKRMTLKASMGQLTVRVAPAVALHNFKPGDKVLVTFGQEGSEPIVTRIERSRL